jgi:hypothetical protein
MPSEASAHGFFGRDLTAAESRIVAVGAAVTWAILAAVSQRMWTSVIGAVALIVMAGTSILAIRITRKPIAGLGTLVTIWFVVFSIAFDDARVLLTGFGAFAVAWMLTRLEQRRGLRRAALLGALRDALWRLFGMIAAAMAALAAADRIERAAFEASFDTPLEGLAFPAGILVGVLVLIALAIGVWSLPRIAAKGMSEGAIVPAAADALWFGALMCAVAVVFDFRAMSVTGTFSEALGRNCWLAVASVFAFAAARLGVSSAVNTDIQALWIIVLGDARSSRELRRHAAVLAARWTNGPVSIVAAPDLAPSWSGAHLRLAQLRGEVEALFPQRPIHFADWVDTLPPPARWQALPIRELYVVAAFWPELFEAHLDANALIVAVGETEPDDGVVDRLRTFLPTARTDFHLPVIETGRLVARWPGVKVYPIVGAGDLRIDGWIATNGKRRETVTGLRLVLIAHAKQDTGFAQALVSKLGGAVDARGRIIRTSTIVVGGSGGILEKAWRRMSANVWRQGVMLRRIRLVSQGRWWKFLATILSFGIDADYDLLLIEQGLGEPVMADDIWAMVGRDGVRFATRVIGVLWPGLPVPSQLPESAYSGLIHRIPDTDAEDQLAEVARRYLALEFAPAVSVAQQQSVAASQRERRLPRVFVSYPAEYRVIAETLAIRLRETCDVLMDLDFYPGDAFQKEMERLAECDTVIAIIAPETAESPWALRELELAAERQKPILLIVIGRTSLPAFIAGVPSNTDAYGDVFDLTEDLAGAELAWDITIANINAALAKLTI